AEARCRSHAVPSHQPRRKGRDQQAGEGLDRGTETDQPDIDSLPIEDERQQRPEQAHGRADGRGADDRGQQASPLLTRYRRRFCHFSLTDKIDPDPARSLGRSAGRPKKSLPPTLGQVSSEYAIVGRGAKKVGNRAIRRLKALSPGPFLAWGV